MTFQPASTAELEQWMQSELADGQQVCWALGQSTDEAAISLCLDQLNEVIDYPYRDMTITVQGGMKVAELNRILAEHGQWLPVNVPRSETMSIAEMIVGHWFGSFVAGEGTVRDWLLGITAVDGQGQLIHSGGRVVKNVAGYDLCKLFVGSHGRLGIPVEVTLQVKTIPETILIQSLQMPTAEGLQKLWRLLRELPFDPFVLDAILNPWRINIAYAGSENVCQQLLQQTKTAAKNIPDCQVSETRHWSPRDDCWRELSDADADQINCFRLGTRPSECIAALSIAADYDWQGFAQASRGTIVLYPEFGRENELNLQMFERLDAIQADGRTFGSLPMGPLSRQESELAEKIRQTFDPLNRF